jgi:hypothetical protein
LVDIGFYSEHIDSYLRYFNRDNIEILIFEEYIADTEHHTKHVLEWLGLPSNGGIIAGKAKNVGYRLVPEGKEIVVQGRAGRLGQAHTEIGEPAPPRVEAEDLDFLNKVYAGEIRHMFEILPKIRSFWPEIITIETALS